MVQFFLFKLNCYESRNRKLPSPLSGVAPTIMPVLSHRLLIPFFSLLAAVAMAAETEATPKVTDVYIVVKSHFDLGFTDLPENVFRRYREEMMDGSLKIIEANRELPKQEQFVWTVPAWPLKRSLTTGMQLLLRPPTSCWHRRPGTRRAPPTRTPAL